MNLACIFLLLSFFQTEVPYKPSDEFQVNIDVVFKIKNSTYAPSTFSGNGDRLDKASATTLPFLSVSVTQIKFQSDELKVMAVNSQGKSIFKKKTAPNLELHFEMGFVDDLKSKVSNSEITVYFLSAEKKELRKIVFSVSSEGVFEVNGKWHGQF